MKPIAILMLLAAMPVLHAQDPKPNDPGKRIFELKFVPPSQMARLLAPINRTFDDQLKVLILTATNAELDQAAQFIVPHATALVRGVH